MITYLRHLLARWAVLVSLLLTACQSVTATLPLTLIPLPTLAPAVDLETVLAALDAVPGWTPSEAVRQFDRDNLYDLMNGQSDAFFVYGFEQVAVQRFTHESSPETVVMAAVYRVNSPASAYGLFTANQAGDPLELGVAGSGKPGEWLCCWQSRYFVQLTALQPLAPEPLDAAARALSAALPTGGPTPEIMARLPLTGSQARFFHEELSIQDSVWLGGENLLGLGADTDGAMARYALPGGDGWLVLVDYPDPQRDQAGAQALKTGELNDLAAYRQQDNHLAAVFGPVDGSAAEQMLKQVLQL